MLERWEIMLFELNLQKIVRPRSTLFVCCILVVICGMNWDLGKLESGYWTETSDSSQATISARF